MNKLPLTALILALTATCAFAAEDKNPNANPADKTTQDMPGTKGGATAQPTAKEAAPNSNLADKTMKDQGVENAGSTAMPNAKPNEGTIPKSQNEGNAGAQK